MSIYVKYKTQTFTFCNLAKVKWNFLSLNSNTHKNLDLVEQQIHRCVLSKVQTLWDNDLDYIFCSLWIGKTLETGPSWTDTIQGADICGSSRLQGSMESALQHQIITLEDCGPVSVFVQVYEVANILSYIRVHTACGSGVGEYNQSLCYASHLW